MICGARSGRRIALSAGIHSREYIGIQALAELADGLRPEELTGTVLILHCFSYDGFLRRSVDVFPQDGKIATAAFQGTPMIAYGGLP